MTVIEELRKKEFQSKKPRIIQAQDDAFNRKVTEERLVDILVFPEEQERKDTLKRLNLSVNSVLANIALKKGVSFGFDINVLKKMPPIKKAQALSRIMYSIAHTKKAQVRLVTRGALKPDHVLLSWGASTKQASQAQSF